jgi:hypothetical protein
MRDRIQKEYELLKKYYPGIIPVESGDSCWFRIPNFPIAGTIWNRVEAAVCFEAKVSYPGTPPYSFYVEGGLRLKTDLSVRPKDYEEPAATAFDGIWDVSLGNIKIHGTPRKIWYQEVIYSISFVAFQIGSGKDFDRANNH